MNYNPFFPGGAISMARVLFDGLVEYEDGKYCVSDTSILKNNCFLPSLGTPATTSQMAKDVVTFLHWAAEPELDERKKIGLKAVILFSALTAISLYVKRAKWAGIKTRKICACKSDNRFASSPADLFFRQYTLLRSTNTTSLLVINDHYIVANTKHCSSISHDSLPLPNNVSTTTYPPSNGSLPTSRGHAFDPYFKRTIG